MDKDGLASNEVKACVDERKVLSDCDLISETAGEPVSRGARSGLFNPARITIHAM